MAYKKESEIRMERIYNHITKRKSELMADYSAIIIKIEDSDKWDYAIPEMYLNYQDGFLFPICDQYRGMPLFKHPEHGTLFLRWAVDWFDLTGREKEKYLCFDRSGKKYTVIIESQGEQSAGNPSYFRFLPKVKKYKPSKRTLKLRKAKFAD